MITKVANGNKLWGVPVIGLLFLAILLVNCAHLEPRPGYNRVTGRTTNKGKPVKHGYSDEGKISYYGPKFHGKKTANGETFDQHALTGAHRSLPFGTKVKVTLLSTGKSVVIRINDRGPFKKSRILDVSFGAAKKLGLIKAGVGRAKLEVL